nr:hypothetical protein [Lyngbya sp. CCY1209]
MIAKNQVVAIVSLNEVVILQAKKGIISPKTQYCIDLLSSH